MATPASGGYKMASIARITGFSPSLLRAWERRYGLLKPDRSSGKHRLYSDLDLQLLLRVKALLHQERSIGEIALIGRKSLLEQAPGFSPALPAHRTKTKSDEPLEPLHSQLLANLAPSLERCRQRIIDAALSMEAPRIESALNQIFSVAPSELVIGEVIEPCARALGELWIKGRCSVAGEHMASSIFLRHLLRLLEEGQPAGETSALILVACFPDENHQLGSLALANGLVRRGYRVAYLGPALPLEDLEMACNLLKPLAACLSVTRQALFLTHRHRFLEVLKRQSQKVRLVVGGSGIESCDEELAEAGALLWPDGRPAMELPNSVFGPLPKESNPQLSI